MIPTSIWQNFSFKTVFTCSTFSMIISFVIVWWIDKFFLIFCSVKNSLSFQDFTAKNEASVKIRQNTKSLKVFLWIQISLPLYHVPLQQIYHFNVFFEPNPMKPFIWKQGYRNILVNWIYIRFLLKDLL